MRRLSSSRPSVDAPPFETARASGVGPRRSRNARQGELCRVSIERRQGCLRPTKQACAPGPPTLSQRNDSGHVAGPEPHTNETPQFVPYVVRLSRVSDVSETPCFQERREAICGARHRRSRRQQPTLRGQPPRACTPRATSVFSESTRMAAQRRSLERPAPSPSCHKRSPELPDGLRSGPPSSLRRLKSATSCGRPTSFVHFVRRQRLHAEAAASTSLTCQPRRTPASQGLGHLPLHITFHTSTLVRLA